MEAFIIHGSRLHISTHKFFVIKHNWDKNHLKPVCYIICKYLSQPDSKLRICSETTGVFLSVRQKKTLCFLPSPILFLISYRSNVRHGVAFKFLVGSNTLCFCTGLCIYSLWTVFVVDWAWTSDSWKQAIHLKTDTNHYITYTTLDFHLRSLYTRISRCTNLYHGSLQMYMETDTPKNRYLGIDFTHCTIR